MKHQTKMMFRRNTSGINLNFDNTISGTPTMFSNMSFISPLSIDRSIDNMDISSFHFIGTPISSEQNSQQHKRKCSSMSDEGNLNCGRSSKGNCLKMRKHRVMRTIKVPVISKNDANIPLDLDYTWRKMTRQCCI